jgi:hypothetical protein
MFKKSIPFLTLLFLVFSFNICSADPAPDSASVKALDSYLNPLQDNPEYYGDRKCKVPLNPAEVNKLIRYNPNFGKKIWMKSHTLNDLKKLKKYLGKLLTRKNYRMSALEISDNVAPHLKASLEGTGIDYNKWADTFEKWGRTYVDPAQGGSKLSDFSLLDCQNGNFLILTPKNSSTKVVYYIAEKYDPIVKAMLTYTPKNEK